MPVKKTANTRHNKGQGGGRYAAFAILVLILLAVGGYYFFSSPRKAVLPPDPTKVEKTVQPAVPLPRDTPQPIKIEPVKPAPEEYPVERVVRPQQTVPTAIEKTAGSGKLAIIIDDMGAGLNEARALADIGVPLTFSIIPGLRSYREVAVYSASKGIETMIHIPMQSKGWPARRLENNGLLVSMSADDISERLKGFIRDIPNATGANNHMGSEFTEHANKMKSVLVALKDNKLFFVDSVTSPQTVGQKVAQELGVRNARRNVFLDNEQNSSYILGQLDQAVRLARKNGAAIAICHPHPMTIKTLAGALPGLEKQGIKFVPASALVR